MTLHLHLRLEATEKDGQEYRICDGRVEVRALTASYDHESPWRRVPPEELTLHVTRGTVIAQWLKQRLGWRRLLRACTPEQDLRLFDDSQSCSEHRAA